MKTSQQLMLNFFSAVDVRAGVKMTMKVATWRAAIGPQQPCKKN
jgi:hypothetical protein